MCFAIVSQSVFNLATVVEFADGAWSRENFSSLSSLFFLDITELSLHLHYWHLAEALVHQSDVHQCLSSPHLFLIRVKQASSQHPLFSQATASYVLTDSVKETSEVKA